MKIRSILGALVITALPFTPVWAENMTPEDIQKLVDEAVNKRMLEHEQRQNATERKEGVPPPAETQYPTPTGPMPDVRVERKGEEKVPLSFSSTGSGKLVYAKPFLSAPKATIGGYADFKYGSSDRTHARQPQQEFLQSRANGSLSLCRHYRSHQVRHRN